MPGAYLFGWDDDNKKWVKVLVNSEGKLIIDPSEIFEEDPTDGEVGKAPTSNWAHDHAANADAHHAHVIDYKEPDATDYDRGISIFHIDDQEGWPVMYAVIVTQWARDWRNVQWCIASDSSKVFFRTHHTATGWSEWREALSDLHAADEDAHHARYTDAEARAACGVDGDLYWSVPGVGFSARYPDIDSVKKAETGQLLVMGDNVVVSARVHLPHGATVKAAVVTGNASAVAGETWELRRIGLDGGSTELLASARIGTEDTSIVNAVIDNENYGYYLVTSSLDNGDEIYGARITYTL